LNNIPFKHRNAVSDQVQLIDQPLDKIRLLVWWASSVSMFLLIAVASCTSNQDFHYLYSLIAEFLSLSKTSLVISLSRSPNLGHFLCYTLLSFSLSGVFSRRNKLIAPLVAGLFGVLMECVQIFIPSRDASLLDIGINFLGVALGFGIYMLWVTYVRPSDKSRRVEAGNASS
jgi:VanZ family protein